METWKPSPNNRSMLYSKSLVADGWAFEGLPYRLLAALVRSLYHFYAFGPSYRTGSVLDILRLSATPRSQPDEESAMTSDVALRIAYFALNIVGGFAMAITFLLLFLNLKRTHDGPFLMSISLSFSRIISPTVSCLLLFSGAMTGNPTSTSVCITQSGLYASQGPLLSYSMLSYALNVLLIIPPPSMLLMGTVATPTMAVLLLLPFLAWAALGVASALIASQNPKSVHVQLFYCFLDLTEIKRCSAILTAIALLATIATISNILYRLYRRRKMQASGSRWLEDIVLQISCLGLYATLRLGFLVANNIKPHVSSDMVDAADSIIIFVILATQPWLFKGWLNTEPAPPAEVPAKPAGAGPDQSADRQHAAFLRRVSQYPSVVDITRSESRQTTDQAPKLRALSMALGLAANDPYTRYHVPDQEKRATIIKPHLEHHPYSLGAHHMGGNSRLSLKSVEYGVALGHPSRDASVQHSQEMDHGTPRRTSLIIISTPSDGSSHAIHLPLEEEAASSSERHRRVPLSPLAPGGGSHRNPRRASDGSIAYGTSSALERIKRGHDSPRRASFLAMSLESASPNSSPWPTRNTRAPVDPSSPYSPSFSARAYRTQELSTGEGSVYDSSNTDSDSSPILVDDITSSVLSWPNISRSTLALPHQRIDDAGTPTSAGFSRSSLASEARWRQYAAGSSEEPPHPSFLREDTPSPLSLNEQGGSIGGHTFGESPVERRFHPYTRGPSPLRPPGLVSPLSRWTEEIEETPRTASNES